MAFAIIYWNDDTIQTGSIPIQMVFGTIGGNVDEYSTSTMSFASNRNSFYGIAGLKYINRNSELDMDVELDSGSRVSVETEYSSYVYASYIIFGSEVCANSAYYYLASASLCYDSCPAGYSEDTTTKSCYTCPYDCSSCDTSLQCTSCDTTNTHRTLNSGRC